MSFMPRRSALRPWEKRNRDNQLALDRVPTPRGELTDREKELCRCGCQRADHVFLSDDCACGRCDKFVAKEAA